MALQAVVYQQGVFGPNEGSKDLQCFLENWNWDFNLGEGDQQFPNHPQDYGYLGNIVDSKPETSLCSEAMEAEVSTKRPKRRRDGRCRKNEEEIESQRMMHIAVERNRRKQMNHYLALLKSLMPESYAQRGDQASIVGGAITYVKELEHTLHCLSARKNSNPEGECSPFGEFFSSPQYSTRADRPSVGRDEVKMSSVAEVEVSMAESHVNLKMGLRKHPKQLLKVVCGLHHLRLSILHLNVTTVAHFVLCSFNLKVEDDSNLRSVDEIATSVHQLLVSIHEELHLG